MLSWGFIRPFLPWILAGAMAAGLMWTFSEWRLTKAELAQEKEDAKQLREETLAAAQASAGYQAELAALRSRPLPSTPVRLCRTTPVPAPAQPGPDATATPAGMVPGDTGVHPEEGPGPDIGPLLRKAAGRADEISAQLRAVQGAEDG